MLFSNERSQLRQMYFEAWERYQTHLPLQPLQQQLVQVILEHPEYHGLFAAKDRLLTQDFLPEHGQSNPFLHLGMHLSLQDQVQTNRPYGIAELFAQHLRTTGDKHASEHAFMECLAETLWHAQRNNHAVDEAAYLAALRQL